MSAPKDYYHTLHIAPNASVQQIKQAYRKLAMLYHPDKHNGDLYMQAFFQEIQEAYEVLSSPQQRAAYHQKRWYHLSTGKKFANHTPNTPFSLLQEAVKLLDHVRGIDIFRMDRNALLVIIQQMLSQENLAMLSTFNDDKTRAEIFHLLLKCSIHFSPAQLKTLQGAMMELANHQPLLQNHWEALLKSQTKQHQWNTYQWLVVIVFSVGMAALIYWIGK